MSSTTPPFDRALRDPAGVFRTPRAVQERQDLSREQKIAILRQWEYDARELQVADDENMTGRPAAPILDQIRDGLRALDASGNGDRAAPTKQGGVGR